ncbi:Nudix hydrolase 26, chloroplastic -like protein [Gossypium arboreum]|uniref:Nudix hydrolase 26, chloroplastic-like protein n=1 Tax=Gossypium arboreum TaxID=29729 RepID=A0A0B0MD67_GOSAR|nr:Nudix hydrolase 26, chloroplastic -like protein [Gossypium arboreum]
MEAKKEYCGNKWLYYGGPFPFTPLSILAYLPSPFVHISLHPPVLALPPPPWKPLLKVTGEMWVFVSSTPPKSRLLGDYNGDFASCVQYEFSRLSLLLALCRFYLIMIQICLAASPPALSLILLNNILVSLESGAPLQWKLNLLNNELYCAVGGIDDNEDPKVAALRELKEETGVSSAEILAEVPYWLTYDFPPEVREKLKHQWGSDWKGQAQKWFLLKFTGKEEEINLLGDGSEKPEFGEWSWMTPEQIVEHAVDFKKPVYNKVLEVFTSYLH